MRRLILAPKNSQAEKRMYTEQSLAETYLRQYHLRDPDDFWAFQQMVELVEADPEALWRITRILIVLAQTDAALFYVAAGPLEDLLKKHGTAFIDRVETAARSDERLRRSLIGVWLRKEDPVAGRWLALMREFGFVDDEDRWVDGL